jgi:hypothetical protein
MSSFRQATTAGSEQPQTIAIRYPQPPAPTGQILRIQIDETKLQDEARRIQQQREQSA